MITQIHDNVVEVGVALEFEGYNVHSFGFLHNPICENLNGYDELPLIARHRYGHLLNGLKYEYLDGTMSIKDLDDEYIKQEIDKANESFIKNP